MITLDAIVDELYSLRDTVKRIESSADDGYSHSSDAIQYAQQAEDAAGTTSSYADDASSYIGKLIEKVAAATENETLTTPFVNTLEQLQNQLTTINEAIGNVNVTISSAISDLTTEPLPLETKEEVA